MSDILPSCDAGSLEPELRLVLLGSIGCGKTLTGDTLLGVPSSPFASGPSPRLCQLRRRTSAGYRLTVVEAPRWYWSRGHMDTDVRKETERALDLCDPGPHAFLLLVPVGQFTEVERRVPSELEVVFGEGVLDHTLVLLTCGDYLMGKEAGHYLEGEDPGLREVIDRCGGQYHVINNRQSQDRNQVRELLEKVENMVQKKKGCYMKQSTLQRENEALARESEREERVREREREELAREKERDERARQKEREERARQNEREERARQNEREERARQKEREERARQKEREERARQNEREERAREERAMEREKELSEVKVQARERVMEGRASERERELREKQAEVEEEKRETVLESRHATVTETRRYWGSRSTVLPKSSLGRRMEEMQRIEDCRLHLEEKEKREEIMRRKEREGMEERREETEKGQRGEGTEKGKELMEERVTAKPVVKSLYSAPVPQQQPSEPRNGGPPVFKRTPSFNLTKEGAILSQLSEDRPEPTKKVVNTIYHRINSSEMKTPSSPRSTPSSPLVLTDASPSSPLFSPAPSSLPPSSSEMRVVMLGRSGSGKSAVGNVLLGREEFVSLPDSHTPITQDCQKGRAIVAGRQVAVVDTPDWFHSDHPPERVRSQLSSCVALAAPGPHAFLLCVPVDQPARAELKALNVLEKVFGPGAIRTHTMVLFTHADRLRKSGKASGGGVDEVERYISSQRRDLLELVERCGDRYHVMEGGARVGGGAEEERRSVEELLEKVERTVREGGGGWYSCTLFQEAEDRVRQRQTEIARERRGGEGSQGLRSPSMQPLTETEEEGVEQEEMEQTREEAERSVGVMELEGLPSLSSPPSFMISIWDAVGEAGVRALSAFPRSVWGNKTGAGAINVENLPSLPSSAQSPSSLASSAQSPSSLPSSSQSPSSLPSSAQSPSSIPSSAQSPSFLRSVWEKVGAGASRIPKSTAGGAFLGALLGVFFGGPVGGAIGATAGSVMTEVGRWRSSTKKNSPEETDLIAGLEGQMDELLKTE